MTFGLAIRKLYPKVVRRHGEGDKSHLTIMEGLAALSLDALSSVAYGPEAIMVTLAVAGAGAITSALPITLVIAGLLGVLVVSFCQVIAVHPDDGGSYAVAKKDLGTHRFTAVSRASPPRHTARECCVWTGKPDARLAAPAARLTATVRT